MTVPTVQDTALQLVGAALAVKLHAELRRPDLARTGLDRCLDLLAQLDDRLPHHPPAPAGPDALACRPAARSPLDGGTP